MATSDLADQLARALTAERPLTMADRAERDDMVQLVLNPGSYTGIGGQRFRPGDVILVHEDQAPRLTTARPGRALPTCRPIDEPEPDARGNFAQPHGAGVVHPDSRKHKKQKAEKVEPGDGQKVIDGQIVEPGHPSDSERGAVDADGNPLTDSSSSSAGGGGGQQTQQKKTSGGSGQGGNQGGKNTPSQPAGQGGNSGGTAPPVNPPGEGDGSPSS